MKILIAYFSQSGTTQKPALYLSEIVRGLAIEYYLYPIDGKAVSAALDNLKSDV